MTKNVKLYIIIPLIIFISLILIGTFLDLQICQTFARLYSHSNFTSSSFARFFEIFGELPLYIAVSVALTILYYYVEYFNNRKTQIFEKIFFILLSFASSFYLFYKMYDYIKKIYIVDIQNELVLESILAGVLTLLYIEIFSFFKKETIQKLFSFAVIVIFACVLSNILTQSSKFLFARARFRTMNLLNNFSLYTPWYKTNDINNTLALLLGEDAFKSFPSGHATAGACLFLITMIPFFFAKLKKFAWIFWGVAIGYSLMLCFARIVAGAHFLTDVTFGTMITYFSIVLFFWLFNYILKFNNTSSGFFIYKAVGERQWKHFQEMLIE